MSLISERDRTGALSGLVAAVAFLLAMALDIKATGSRANDLRLLAGMVPPLRRRWLLSGTVMHLINGLALGVLYARVEDRVDAPGWLKGTAFALIENMVLWPIITVLDRVHPEIQEGTLPKFNRPVPFLQEIFRHVVYGAVLGAAYDRLRNGQRG
jgi:hypothetical protein